MYNFEIMNDGQMESLMKRDQLKDALIAELKSTIQNLEEQLSISEQIISKQDDIIARQDAHIKAVKDNWEITKRDILAELDILLRKAYDKN